MICPTLTHQFEVIFWLVIERSELIGCLEQGKDIALIADIAFTAIALPLLASMAETTWRAAASLLA